MIRTPIMTPNMYALQSIILSYNSCQFSMQLPKTNLFNSTGVLRSSSPCLFLLQLLAQLLQLRLQSLYI